MLLACFDFLLLFLLLLASMLAAVVKLEPKPELGAGRTFFDPTDVEPGHYLHFCGPAHEEEEAAGGSSARDPASSPVY